MEPTATRPCVRCATPLEQRFRFCPECGLPAAGDGVLSTQIQEMRHRAEESGAGGARPWRRVALPVGAAAMVAFVLAVGLVLFNRPLLDRVLPPPEVVEPAPVPPAPPSIEPEWVFLRDGRFLDGPPGAEPEHVAEIGYDFRISKHEITSELWWEFLKEEVRGLQERRVWSDAVPGANGGWATDAEGNPYPPEWELDRPVRNVSALAVAEYVAWLDRRVGDPHHEIRMPSVLEWEYAARGSANRRFPWGHVFKVDPVPQSGLEDEQLRKGLQGAPLAVYALDDDVTPEGVVGLGTNVSEFAIAVGYLADDTILPNLFAPAYLPERLAGRQVLAYRCGAAFNLDERAAEEAALTWNVYLRDIEARARFTNVGVRLVKVPRN